ncbi:MAG: hypothetical protein KatS3mg109_1271 [Pirellulaceae bacterium]|nr:MAG: hypothetical protein KatS3mg109_1271 [Pirellulaceae bacterium]
MYVLSRFDRQRVKGNCAAHQPQAAAGMRVTGNTQNWCSWHRNRPCWPGQVQRMMVGGGAVRCWRDLTSPVLDYLVRKESCL